MVAKKIMMRRRRPGVKRGIKKRRFGARRRLQQVKGGALVAKGALAVGAAAMQAYRGRYAPAVKKVTEDASSSGYTQWSSRQYTKSFGRFTQAKLNKLQMDRTIFVWRRLRNLDDGLGTLWMNNYWTAGSAAGVPLYIVELDSCINEQGGNIISASPVWTMTRSDAGVYSWINVLGNSVTDPAQQTSNWTLERGDSLQTSFANYPKANSILRWSDIRADLWGMKNHPCKYVVELCQLREEVVPGGANIDDSAGRFWDAQLRSFVSNPNFAQPGYGESQYKKILDRKEFHINPTSTTESDPDPHCRTMKLFYRFNRYCNYAWRDQAVVGERVSNANFGAPIVQPRAISDNQLQTHPNARLFLMIRATKFVRSATEAGQTNADTPSISLQVRSCHAVVE